MQAFEFVGPTGSFPTITEADGAYRIRLPRGTYSANITAIVFCKETQSVSVPGDRNRARRDLKEFILMDCSDCPPMDIDFDVSDLTTFPDFSKVARPSWEGVAHGLRAGPDTCRTKPLESDTGGVAFFKIDCKIGGIAPQTVTNDSFLMSTRPAPSCLNEAEHLLAL